MTINRAQSLRGAGLLLTLAVLVWADGAQAQRLDDILEAAVAASGGSEALGRIATVRRTGTFTMGTDFSAIERDTEVVSNHNTKVYQGQNS